MLEKSRHPCLDNFLFRSQLYISHVAEIEDLEAFAFFLHLYSSAQNSHVALNGLWKPPERRAR